MTPEQERKQHEYRNKKNRQLWATIRDYADVLAHKDVMPITGKKVLKNEFEGRNVVDLSAADEKRFWMKCAEELVRRHVRLVYDSDHISELTTHELLTLSEDVQTMIANEDGAESPPPPKFTRGAIGMTDAQRNTIDGMYAALGWNEQRRKGYSQRIIKKDAPDTRTDASKMIKAIQAEYLHEVDWEEFALTVRALQDSYGLLDTYKIQLITDAAQKLATDKKKISMGLVCKVYEAAEKVGLREKQTA